MTNLETMSGDQGPSRAAALHEEGLALSEAGDEDAAIGKYGEAVALDPTRADSLYNLGLLYKYRGAWRESLDYNQRANAIRPGDEATQWNLAIAATALGEWSLARATWAALGITVADGEGPIRDSRGFTPVRLNEFFGDGRPVEVVWSEALCPVRSRLVNIPTGATGFRYGDVVLHDGAANGYRLNGRGQECPVFNILGLLEPSPFATFEVTLNAASESALAALETLCDAAGLLLEDWTATMRNLCRACSEGRPHASHDHELSENAEWSITRRIGIAAQSREAVETVLTEWGLTAGREVMDVKCTLAAAFTEQLR